MKVTVARIYCTEAKHVHEKLFRRLHDQEKVRGVTMIRAISGFGASGQIYSSHLIDLSMDLPVIIEFFDKPERVEKILADLEDLLKPGRVLTFSARSR